MDFSDVARIKHAGFTGFKTFESLWNDPYCIPAAKGVYLILTNDFSPQFLNIGTGGSFKGKNPNVPIELLKANWIPASPVLYIGKAGNIAGSATLRSRLIQYLRFGQGRNVGHWGGRYIWQLKNSHELLVCWRNEIDPRAAEKLLIGEFISKHNRLPFANLQR
jgi:hypothetical protein